jgi:ABC-type microcin C transport system permease subunit YejE
MTEKHPVGYFFYPKVVVIMVITGVFLGVILILMIRLLRYWGFMPVLFGLIISTVFTAGAYWVNNQNWFRD